MSDAHTIELQKLEHLGLLAGLARKIKLVEKMDQLLPQKKSNNVNISHGQAILGMILQGLGFSSNRLYLAPEFFKCYAVQKLFGDKVKASDFNASVMSRAIDAVYEYGPSRFVLDVLLGIATEQKLLKKFYHIDTSSFYVTGKKYSKDGDFQLAHGYSKDHRFDLKQLVFTLLANEDGIPLYSETHSGNASDNQIFQNIMEKLESDLQCIGENRFFVLDSSVYNKEFLKNGNICSYWLTRVTESVKSCREAVEKDYEDEQWTVVDKDYKFVELTSEYAGVKQRWILVRNRKAKYKELANFEKKLEKDFKNVKSLRDKLEARPFETKEEIELEVKQLQKRFSLFNISYTVNPRKKRFKGIKRKVRVGYKASICIQKNEDKIEKKKLKKGRFVLATNCMLEEEISSQEMLEAYRSRNKCVESGFKFLKSKELRLSQLHLNKKSRIEAMMAILTLTLFMNNLAEKTLRESLTKEKATIPDQKNQPTRVPTFRWASFLMRNVTLVKLKVNEKFSEVIQSVTKEWQTIVRAFGSDAMEIYGVT